MVSYLGTQHTDDPSNCILPQNTNVIRLVDVLAKNPKRQVVYYQVNSTLLVEVEADYDPWVTSLESARIQKSNSTLPLRTTLS